MSVPLRYDQLDPTRQSAISANVAKMRAGGAPDADVETYLTQHEHLAPAAAPDPNQKLHDEYKVGNLGRRMASENATDTAEAQGPGYATEALGGLASFARDIPGAEAAQSGVRALVRGQSYRDARSDIRGAEESAPAAVRIGNGLVGGTIAAASLPKVPFLSKGGAALQGAQFGTLSALGKSDPNASLKDRIDAVPLQAAYGAAAGKGAELLGTVGRSLFAKSLGSNALARKAATAAADATNYGKAEAEGAAAGLPVHPAVTKALAEPDIAPYADAVRNSRAFAGADDNTVLREAYKLLSERQGTLGNRIVNATDYKAGTSLDNADIKLAKDELQSAADHEMPSFRGANAEHARMAGETRSFQEGADAGKRIINGTQSAGKKLVAKSPESFSGSIPKMTPAQAAAANEGMLGRAKDNIGLSPNPLKLFGLPKSLLTAQRIAPFVQQLDEQSLNGLPAGFRGFGIAAGTKPNSP